MKIKDDAAQDAPRILRSLVRLFAPHWREALWMLAFGTLAACVPMATAAINREVVDRFLEPGAVWRLASVWSLLVISSALLAAASAWVSFLVGRAIAVRLARAVFDRLVRQSLRYHERNKVSAAHLLLGRCVEQIGGHLTLGLGWVIAAAIQAVGGLSGMALMNLRWALAAAAALVICCLVPFGVLYRRQVRIAGELVELDAQTIDIVSQVFDDDRLRVVKRNGLESRFINAFVAATDAQENVMRRRRVGEAAVIQMGITVPLLAVPLVWLATSAASGSLGQVAAFGLLVPQVFAAILRIVGWYFEFADSWPYLQHALAVVDEPLEDGTATDPSIQLADLAGAPLILEDLRCTLGDSEVLHGISLVTAPGSYTAIVGPNGAGKTTLLNVITGVTTPERDAAARIGPIPIARIPRAVLARHVRAIDSTPVTFAGTARENIVLLEPNASQDEIDWACRLAQIAYPIDRAAMKLSTGEKVQMLVAQAVLARPAILLLDEGLKHLHPTARTRVRTALREQLSGTAIFEVIHEGAVRSRAVTNIVVIDNGVIAEQGTHDQLMRLGGSYARYVADSER